MARPKSKKSSSKKKSLKATNRPRQKSKKNASWQKRSFFFCVKWGFVAGLCLLAWLLYDLPSADDVKPLDTRPSLTVLAHDGTLLARYGGLKGVSVDVNDLPKTVSEAVLAIEDRRFYGHFGIDPLGLARAMWANVRAGAWVQGGSTITQQLAKNLFLTPDKTLRRKGQEALLAMWIEYKYTKDEILTAYLNRVYFGAGAFGIDAAAKTYFDKSAAQLTLWESAVLAGLLKAPSRFSPSSSPQLASDRARVVLNAMFEAGFIDEKTAEEASPEKPDFAVASSGNDHIERYFTDWVINQIDSFVNNNERDLVIQTTFDVDLQTKAVEAKNKLFATMSDTEKSKMQVGVVSMSKDGAILAMIGGKDYSKSQFNRATQAMRQPGSAFKPFVFLAALEAGFSPKDDVIDAPLTEGSYRPENYGRKYNGVVTIEDALVFSLNTATIRLLKDVGISKLLDVTKRLGFTHDFKAELATGLGASESNVLEMTNAYTVIANGGYAVWPYAVLSIKDDQGNVLYQHQPTTYSRLFSGSDIDDLDQMLTQVVSRGTGRGAQLSRGHVAGKTGTSQDYRDAWFVGYNNQFTTGVWMGHDDNSPMDHVTGGKYPAQLWRGVMEGGLNVTVPDFANRFAIENPSGGFLNMLERWSSDAPAANRFGGFYGSKDTPQYNP